MTVLPLLADDRSTETCYSCHSDTQRDSHPVGTLYDQARITGSSDLVPSTSPSPFGSTVAKDLLVEGRVECVSCHFTHAEETSVRYRLRIPDNAPQRGYTALCVSCHDMSGR